jgi:hypothetical protein
LYASFEPDGKLHVWPGRDSAANRIPVILETGDRRFLANRCPERIPYPERIKYDSSISTKLRRYSM